MKEKEKKVYMGLTRRVGRKKGFDDRGQVKRVRESAESKKRTEAVKKKKEETLDELLEILEPKKKIDLSKYQMWAVNYIYEDDDYEQIGVEILEWLENNPDARKCTEFLVENKISYDDFEAMRRNSPMLSKIWNFAKMKIGNRREMDAYHGKGDKHIVMLTLGNYCTEAREWQKTKAEWAKKEEAINAPQVIFAQYEKIPD